MPVGKRGHVGSKSELIDSVAKTSSFRGIRRTPSVKIDDDLDVCLQLLLDMIHGNNTGEGICLAIQEDSAYCARHVTLLERS